MENMKITELCDDLLKTIEIEGKYINKEKIQRDLKSKITHFFIWYSYGFGWDTLGDEDSEEEEEEEEEELIRSIPNPSRISINEFDFDETIKCGYFPAWKRGRTGDATIIEWNKIMSSV